MAKYMFSLMLFVTLAATLPVPKSPGLWEYSLQGTFSMRRKGIGAECKTKDDCLTSLFCTDFRQYTPCMNNSTVCNCTPMLPRKCETQKDCDGGEKCEEAKKVNSFPKEGMYCNGKGVQKENKKNSTDKDDKKDKKDSMTEKKEDGGCIAVHHLEKEKRNNLIYKVDRVARVLCDERNSCATPGHMVLFRGHTMMTSGYCNYVGCVEKVMKVNSPMFERRKTVKSHREELEFTVFSARFETRLEEQVLSALIRAGY